jgi:hypothetical protein
MNAFPTDSKKIRTLIQRYKRQFAKEENEFGQIWDRNGHRYLISTLYMILGDNTKALTSFQWFNEKFPDDVSDPEHHLCWTLCLHRAGQKAESESKLIQTACQNLYLIPRLIGQDIDRLDIWHSSNYAEKEYLDDTPQEYWDLWTEEDITWAQGYWQRDEIKKTIVEYIELSHQLLTSPGGSDERTAILDKMRTIELQRE